MTYFLEDIYDQMGMYNTTVIITLNDQSEEYNLYGGELMGTLIYSNREKESLVKKIRNIKDGVGKTQGQLRLKLLNEENIPKENIRRLRQHGISSVSISNLSFLTPLNNNDAYQEEGIKEIPNQINIDFEIGPAIDLVNINIGLYNRKHEGGWSFIDEEIAEFIALEKLFVDNKSEQLIKEYNLGNNDLIKDKINFYYYQYKYWINKKSLVQNELEEFYSLHKKNLAEGVNCFNEEIIKIDDNPKQFLEDREELEIELYKQVQLFKPHRLVEKETVIWWGRDSFAHIMFNHALEFKNDKETSDKTRFQYRIKEVIRIIKIICEMIHQDFIECEQDVFYREGNRAIDYNGNHYCLRIDKGTGMLTQFFPYEKDI